MYNEADRYFRAAILWVIPTCTKQWNCLGRCKWLGFAQQTRKHIAYCLERRQSSVQLLNICWWPHACRRMRCFSDVIVICTFMLVQVSADQVWSMERKMVLELTNNTITVCCSELYSNSFLRHIGGIIVYTYHFCKYLLTCNDQKISNSFLT